MFDRVRIQLWGGGWRYCADLLRWVRLSLRDRPSSSQRQQIRLWLSLPPEQDMYPSVTVMLAYLRDLDNTQAQRTVVCCSLPYSGSLASVSSFLSARPEALSCQGSDWPPVSSAAGFSLPAGAYASVPGAKCSRISCATYRTWHRKCLAYSRPPAPACPAQPASGQRQSAFLRIVILSPGDFFRIFKQSIPMLFCSRGIQ